MVILLVVVAVNMTASLFAVNAEPQVIPAVQYWQGGEGVFDSGRCRIVVDSSYRKELKAVAQALCDDLVILTGRKTAIRNGSLSSRKKDTIFLTLNMNGQTVKPEGYILEINDGIVIRSESLQGLFWGTRTLCQMMGQGRQLPRGTITDYPEYKLRSILLDVGRKFIPFDELLDWVRTISYFKMNEVHLHLNDNCAPSYPGFRLEMKTIPGLASEDGFYTQDQIRQLQDFAAVRGVTITPEIDSPGHSRAFTKVRPDLALRGWGAQYLDINNEQTYRFMEKVFDEVVPLFDSPEIHIGTDEYRLSGNDEQKQMIGETFRQYINHFSDYIGQKGKTVRIWSGYEHMPGTTEPDRSIVIDMWVTADAVNKSKAGYKLINSTHLWTYIVPGAPYYGVSHSFLYNDWTPLKFSNEPDGQLQKGDPALLGAKLHVWNDMAPGGYTTNEIARLSYPSIIVMAEKMWGTKGSEDFEAFRKKAAKIMAGGEGKAEFLDGTHGSHSQSNPLIGEVPKTTFLRRAGEVQGDVVWRLDEPMYFIENTSKQLNLPQGVETLEYPWTASFTVTRHKDISRGWEIRPRGNEMLLTSDLATLYLDYTHELRDKKGLVEGSKRGVALVRANYDIERLPIESHKADILVWDYQVPLNKQVTLTFVGQLKKTSLYVDGKLIGRFNKQMVCPVTRLGDTYPNAFQGILHEAVIYDVAPQETIVGHWKPEQMSQEWKVLDWNIAEGLKGAGQYQLTFQYTGGAHRLDLAWVALVQDGKEVSRDEHPGTTGRADKDNVYVLELERYDENSHYSIRAHVRSDAGTDSKGDIGILRMP